MLIPAQDSPFLCLTPALVSNHEHHDTKIYNSYIVLMATQLACLLAYVASVVVGVASRVIALQPALSPVAATTSSCESWMSSQSTCNKSKRPIT